MNRLNIPTAMRISRKDIKILLKERGTLLYLFLIPILFILAFGGAANVDKAPQEEVITLPVVNLDTSSEASQTLLEALEHVGSIENVVYKAETAQTLLDLGKIKRMLTIPANYGADLQAGHPVTLRLVNAPDANPTKTEAVHRIITGVAADLSLETQLITSFRQMADMQAAASPEQQSFRTEIIVEQAQSQFTRAKTEPLLSIEANWPQHLMENGEQDVNPLSVYVPGFAVLFIFLTAQTSAQSIFEEKKVGSFRRLLAAPISKPTILVGKMTPNFITGLTQIIVFFAAGVFVFPLVGLDGMPLGNDPLALVLSCFVLLLCSMSLGILIAAVARSESQISGISAVVLWVFGFAGIWLTRTPSTSFYYPITKLIPHCWANAVFIDLLVRGQGMADIVPSILILLGFTVVFFAIGLWRFDFNNA